MSVDITWVITATIAISSFLSPIAVSIINNRHHAKIRRLELEHDELIRKMNMQQLFDTRQSDIYYSDKKNAFSDFTKQAGAFSMNKQSPTGYMPLHSAIDTCLLFCSGANKQLLCNFQQYIDLKVFGHEFSPDERTSYSEKVNEVALALNAELESTKPVIQSETGKR